MAHDDLTFSQFFKICLPCHIRVSCKDKVGFRREHSNPSASICATKVSRVFMIHVLVSLKYSTSFSASVPARIDRRLRLYGLKLNLIRLRSSMISLLEMASPTRAPARLLDLERGLAPQGKVIVLVQQRYSTLCTKIHIRFVDHHQLLRIVL